MQPSTVSRILPIVADAIDLDPVRQRQRILDEIFACESLMFSGLGSPVRRAFFERKGCVPIQKFTHDCRSRCRGGYYGISLPVEVEKAEVFRIEGQRITVASQHAGPIAQWSCRSYHCPVGVDLGQGWSLPVDPVSPLELGFRIQETGDNPDPVMVGVEYFDLNGTRHREDVEAVHGQITFTSRTVGVLAMNGITLPPGRCHYIEVWSGTESKLEEFHPSIDVPNHRRIAISAPMCGENLVSFEDALYVPMRPMFDSDRVETGDPNFWRNLIQWKDLHFKTKRSPSEERAYASTGQFLVAQANQMLEIREPESLEVIVEPELPHRDIIRGFRNLDRRHILGRGWR